VPVSSGWKRESVIEFYSTKSFDAKVSKTRSLSSSFAEYDLRCSYLLVAPSLRLLCGLGSYLSSGRSRVALKKRSRGDRASSARSVTRDRKSATI
jgi:hypothetical protein